MVQFSMNLQRELAYWRKNKYSASSLARSFEKLADSENAIKVDFDKPSPVLEFKKRYSDTFEYRVHILAVLIQQIALRYPGIKGEYIFCVTDCRKDDGLGPTIAYGKKKDDYSNFLIPDSDFIESSAYESDSKVINQLSKQIPWSSKQATAFWRGSSTGRYLNGDKWQENIRVKLCLIAKEVNDKLKLDAALTRIVQCNKEENVERLRAAGVVGEYVPFNEFVKYKYLIDVDGNACAWSSLFRKLYSNSVVLKVESDNTQWYYDSLIPWEHYIPIKSDLSDLSEKIDWARAHDRQCEEIAYKGTLLAEEIRQQDAVEYVAEVLLRIASCKEESDFESELSVAKV